MLEIILLVVVLGMIVLGFVAFGRANRVRPTGTWPRPRPKGGLLGAGSKLTNLVRKLKGKPIKSRFVADNRATRRENAKHLGLFAKPRFVQSHYRRQAGYDARLGVVNVARVSGRFRYAAYQWDKAMKRTVK